MGFDVVAICPALSGSRRNKSHCSAWKASGSEVLQTLHRPCASIGASLRAHTLTAHSASFVSLAVTPDPAARAIEIFRIHKCAEEELNMALRLTSAEVKGIFEKCSNWGRWGKDDERG